MGVHWPETTKFCGLFPLATGIYTYIALHLFENCWWIRYYWTTYNQLLFVHNNAESDEPTEDETIQQRNVYLRIVTTFVIALTAFASVQIVTIALLIYGYWKSKPIFMKIYVYYAVIIWTFKQIVNIIIVFFINMFGRLILVTLILLTGYMLLVLRTIYLQVAGKSQIMTTPTLNSPSHSISESLEENTTVIMQGIVNETSNRERSDAFHSGASDEISESDNVTPRFTETNSISTTSSNISSDDTGRNDRRQTEEHNNLCTNTNNSRFDENVNVLEVTNIQQCTRSDKIADDEKTIPVIYDETQLNICGTPILEENPINRIVLSNIS